MRAVPRAVISLQTGKMSERCSLPIRRPIPSETNQKTIDTAVRYTHEHRMTSTMIPIEKLFRSGSMGPLVQRGRYQCE